LPDNQSDSIFYQVKLNIGDPDRTLAVEDLKGRIGNNPGGLGAAYSGQLCLLESVLLNQRVDKCVFPTPHNITSVMDLPISVRPGTGGAMVFELQRQRLPLI